MMSPNLMHQEACFNVQNILIAFRVFLVSVCCDVDPSSIVFFHIFNTQLNLRCVQDVCISGAKLGNRDSSQK